MVTGHYPFSDDEIDDYYETMYNILENTVIFYDEDEIYDPLYDIFYQCCNPDVYSRITIEGMYLNLSIKHILLYNNCQ